MSHASGEKGLEEGERMDIPEEEMAAMDDDVDVQPSRPDEDEGCRASSSSSSDSSVAVNCCSFPSEVVVHGQKVKKVRVLFNTPFPPRKSASYGHDHATSYPFRRRLPASSSSESLAQRFRTSGSTTVAQATDDVSHEILSLPLSQEESSEYSTDTMQQVFSDTPGDMDRVNGENRIRCDIQSGIALIAEKMEGLLLMNKKLRMDLDNEVRKNKEMKDSLIASDARWQVMEKENSELKQMLDSKEKEAMRLGGQVKDEWERRIQMEEDLMKLRNVSDLEIGNLKAMIEAKNIDIRQLEVELRNRKETNEKENKNKSREDMVELLAQIKMLEDTVLSLRKEKAEVSELTRGLEAEVESWKQKYEKECHGMEMELRRLEMQKNSYAKLYGDTMRLAKSRGRVLCESQQAWSASSTQPQHSLSASVIHLPEQGKSGTTLPGGLLQSQTHVNRSNLTASGSRISNQKQFSQVRRQSHDSEQSSCSLPPVPKNSK